MRITIEQNVPIPARKHGRPSMYPFAGLGVGDSFFVDGGVARNLYGHISHMKRKFPDRVFAIRKVEGGVRVWRTE